MENMQNPIVEIKNLKMYFPLTKGLFEKKYGEVRAVDDVSISVETGKTFGLVGESGCGKTTVGKCVLRIYSPTGGEIIYQGVDLAQLSAKEMKQYRRDIQMIFQDPYGSLDPRQSVFSILKEAIIGDGKLRTKNEIENEVERLLSIVELSPNMVDRYPHEMSGGQRQRLGIARALACNPKLIVCDEPVSALDVSIQAQIINLFEKLQKELGISYIFIAHDLAVVRHIAHQIGIMYLGHLVEMFDAAELYDRPLHPYTKALLSAVPTTNYDKERTRERKILQGEVPSPIHMPSGCPFHPRCEYACEKCKNSIPILSEFENGHYVACHRVAEINSGGLNK